MSECELPPIEQPSRPCKHPHTHQDQRGVVCIYCGAIVPPRRPKTQVEKERADQAKIRRWEQIRQRTMF